MVRGRRAYPLVTWVVRTERDRRAGGVAHGNAPSHGRFHLRCVGLGALCCLRYRGVVRSLGLVRVERGGGV
jgi:hypothetical protein